MTDIRQIREQLNNNSKDMKRKQKAGEEQKWQHV